MLQNVLQDGEETLSLFKTITHKAKKNNNNFGENLGDQAVNASVSVENENQNYGKQSDPCPTYETGQPNRNIPSEREKMENSKNNFGGNFGDQVLNASTIAQKEDQSYSNQTDPCNTYESGAPCAKVPCNAKNMPQIRKFFCQMVMEGLFEEGISRQNKVQFQIMLHLLMIDDMSGKLKGEILGVVKERLSMLERLKMHEVAAVLLLVRSFLGSLNFAVDINAFYNEISHGISYIGRMILTFFENKKFEFSQLLSR